MRTNHGNFPALYERQLASRRLGFLSKRGLANYVFHRCAVVSAANWAFIAQIPNSPQEAGVFIEHRATAPALDPTTLNKIGDTAFRVSLTETESMP